VGVVQNQGPEFPGTSDDGRAPQNTFPRIDCRRKKGAFITDLKSLFFTGREVQADMAPGDYIADQKRREIQFVTGVSVRSPDKFRKLTCQGGITMIGVVICRTGHFYFAFII